MNAEKKKRLARIRHARYREAHREEIRARAKKYRDARMQDPEYVRRERARRHRRKTSVLAPDILDRARVLLSKNTKPEDPAVQRADAVTVEGAPCTPGSPEARRYSIMGALLVAALDAEWDELLPTINAIAGAIGVEAPDADERGRVLYQAVWNWEDAPGRTVADVLAVFKNAKEAIPRGEAKAAA